MTSGRHGRPRAQREWGNHTLVTAEAQKYLSAVNEYTAMHKDGRLQGPREDELQSLEAAAAQDLTVEGGPIQTAEAHACHWSLRDALAADLVDDVPNPVEGALYAVYDCEN